MVIFGCPPAAPQIRKFDPNFVSRRVGREIGHYFWAAGAAGRRHFRAREAQGKDTRKEEGFNTPEAKCHMTILTTLYDNHTILDRPPNIIYDLVHNHMT